MQKRLQYDMLLICAEQDQFHALALREWLELEGVGVLSASLPVGMRAGGPSLAQFHEEGLLALCILPLGWGVREITKSLDPLLERARGDWQRFLILCQPCLEPIDPPILSSVPIHWQAWEGSYRALAQAMVQELVGKGWQRPQSGAKRSPNTGSTPRTGNQTIKGNRNIQIGGDLNTGSGFTLNT